MFLAMARSLFEKDLASSVFESRSVSSVASFSRVTSKPRLSSTKVVLCITVSSCVKMCSGAVNEFALVGEGTAVMDRE